MHDRLKEFLENRREELKKEKVAKENEIVFIESEIDEINQLVIENNPIFPKEFYSFHKNKFINISDANTFHLNNKLKQLMTLKNKTESDNLLIKAITQELEKRE